MRAYYSYTSRMCVFFAVLSTRRIICHHLPTIHTYLVPDTGTRSYAIRRRYPPPPGFTRIAAYRGILFHTYVCHIDRSTIRPINLLMMVMMMMMVSVTYGFVLVPPFSYLPVARWCIHSQRTE